MEDTTITSEDNAVDINVLANDTDVDGNAATLVSATNGTNGTTSINAATGVVTYTPNTDFNGTDTFTYTNSEGNSESVTVTVNAVADVPTLAFLGTQSTNFISGTEAPYEGPFVYKNAGWETESEAIENHNGFTPSDGSYYFELNTDVIGNFADSANIFQDIQTHDGATYILSFDFSPRPGIDASTNVIEVLWDGVVVDTISQTGVGLSDTSWTNYTYSFTGDGDVSRLEFREAGVDLAYGRGGFLDNISLDEVVSGAAASGFEGTSIGLPGLSASLNDSYGSEILVLSVDDIPVGAVLSDGTNSFTATIGNTSVDVSSWDLNSMTVTPTTDFTGQFEMMVTATAVEALNSHSESISEALTVTVINDNVEEAFNSVYGNNGDNILNGTSGNDAIHGRAGNDRINSNDGDDYIRGSEGNDILIAGTGIDTFVWASGDDNTTASPAVDSIQNFSGSDILHLSDLLQGESSDSATLDAYLDFSYVGTDTVIDISVDGIAGPTQQIVLENNSLASGGVTDQAILDSLLTAGQIVTD